MAYTALYRKWRPNRFEDVRGQEHIVRTLKNQIKSDRVGHAYLFCGTRGTGKTSIAKIFARTVNCEHPIDGSPCNECPTCRSILAGTSVNVVEIDAASNNGVDNIREIRDEVQYSPTDGKYRVYIIDEVHMLSAGAFNALLKTLEEPPSYVIFILATTEAHKIPITVLSRCQRYDFRRIANDTISDQISMLLEAEGVEAEPAAVRYVAKAADGSMRDALSLLEQCISFYYGQKLTYENVLDVLGAVDTQVFSGLLRKIIENDVPGCILQIDEISSQGRDLGQFVSDFTWYQRNLMLVQTAAHGAEALEMSEDSYQALKEESRMIDLDTLMRNIRICSELANQIRYAVSKRVLIEMAMIKMMRPQMEDDIDSLKARITAMETQIASGKIETVVVTQNMPETAGRETLANQQGETAGPVQTIELTDAEYEDYQKAHEEWPALVRLQSPLIRSLLRETRLSYDKAKGLCILFYNPFNYAAIMKEDRLEEIQKVLESHYGKKLQVAARSMSQGEGEPKVVRGSHISGIEMEISVEEDS